MCVWQVSGGVGGAVGREVSRMLRCALEANAPASDKLEASRNLQSLLAQGNGYTGDTPSSPRLQTRARLLVYSCARVLLPAIYGVRAIAYKRILLHTIYRG